MKRIGYAAALGIAGCHLVFGLDDPTLGEPSAQTGTGATTAGPGGGAGGGTAGSGGAPLPCTEVPCVVWSQSLGEEDAGDVTPEVLAAHEAGNILLGGVYEGTIEIDGQSIGATGTEGFVASLEDGGAPLALQTLANTTRPNSVAGFGPQWVVSGTNTGPGGLPNNCSTSANNGFFVMVMDSMAMCSTSLAHAGGIGTSAVVSARDTDVWFAGKTFTSLNLGGPCTLTSNGGAADLFVATADGALGCKNILAFADAGNPTLASASWPAPNAMAPHSYRVLTFWGSDAFAFGNDSVQGGPGSGALALFDNLDGSAIAVAEFTVFPGNGLRALRSAQSPSDGSIWALLAFTGDGNYNSNALGGFDFAVAAPTDVDTMLFQYSGGGAYIGPETPPAIDGMGEQRGESIAVDSQGNVYVAGWFEGEINLGSGFVPSNGLKDAFVLKFGPTGILAWGVRWGDANDQAATHIAVTADDHVIVAGTYDGVIDFGPVQHESSGATSTFIVELSPELP